MTEPRIIMKIGQEFLEFFHVVYDLVRATFFGWALYLMRRILKWKKYKERQSNMGGGGRGQSRIRCIPISDKVYRRPDPTIYSQSYLATYGIAVTWNNPDIELRKGGISVSSDTLEPDMDYEVVARIWNNSTDAPAIHLPVRFSYLSFGIGSVRIPIGETVVNLPVKGAPDHPTFAQIIWHTPTTPGHYCLLVELVWSDDANPLNNIGQENTNVVSLNSPQAQFSFPIYNETKEHLALHLEVDAYEIPPLSTCEKNQGIKESAMSNVEIQEHLRGVIKKNSRQSFPVPEGWQIDLTHKEFVLEAREQEMVTVNITAPDDFHGRQILNISAFNAEMLFGGITMYVTSQP